MGEIKRIENEFKELRETISRLVRIGIANEKENEYLSSFIYKTEERSLIVDVNSRILWANKEMTDAYGSCIIGKSCDEVFGDRLEIIGCCEEAVESKIIKIPIFNRMTGNLSLVVGIVRNINGELLWFIRSLDITDNLSDIVFLIDKHKLIGDVKSGSDTGT